MNPPLTTLLAGLLISLGALAQPETPIDPEHAPPAFMAAEDVAEIPMTDVTLAQHRKMRYALLGPLEGQEKPAEGWKLLVVMPGGDGSIGFHSFVRRILKHGLPEGYVVAHLVAPIWSGEQARSVVWPTEAHQLERVEFSTEEFVDAVITDVKERMEVDAESVFSLAWSSSGPAAYSAALAAESQVTGSLIAMSVYKPALLPADAVAQGRSFYLLQSPDDQVTPFRFAEEAERDLSARGARVTVHSYAGGHGWRGPVYEWIRTGVEWLEGE